MAEVFETFGSLLGNKKWLETYRDELCGKTFGLDKDEINSYVMLIIEQIKDHMDKHIEFISILDEYETLADKAKKELLKGVSLSSISIGNMADLKGMELQYAYSELERVLVPGIAGLLAGITIKMQAAKDPGKLEIQGTIFTQKGLGNIAKAITKYAEIEKKLLDEYEPILAKLNK